MDDINAALHEGGAITLDQAAGLLAERRREPEREEPEAAPVPEPELPAGWDEADRAELSKLSPEARQRIAARERQRVAQTEQRQRELAEQRRAVEQERQAAAAWLAHSLPGMAKAVQEKYAAVDWAKLAREDAPGYVAKRAEYDAEVQRLDGAHREAERAAAALAARAEQDHRAFLKREQEALAKLVPDLTDEAKGQTLKETLRTFAAEAGYTPDQIAWATARDVATLYDAYRWRQAQAKRAEAEKKSAPTVQRPGMGVDRGEREAAAYADGLKRLERTGRIEDALAVMRIKRKG